MTSACALIDVAKNARCLPPHSPWKVCVLERLWITFESELLSSCRSPVSVVKIGELLQKAIPWSSACAGWLPFWVAEDRRQMFRVHEDSE